MKPCAQIRRELYLPASPGVTQWVKQRYIGTGMRLEEERRDQRLAGDFHENFRRRFSEDNGKTWSDWCSDPDPPMKDGYTLIKWGFATGHDPAAGVAVQAFLHRLSRGAKNEGVEAWWQHQIKAYADHMFIEHSRDEGRTWVAATQIQFAPAATFNEQNWADTAFLNSNEAYGGYAFTVNRAGQLVYPLSLPGMIHRNDDGSTETVIGVRCAIGTWDAGAGSHRWKIGADITVPHRVSGRGLDEPEITTLINGDLLLSMRGTNRCDGPDKWKGNVESPGRAWFCVSKDGGENWGPVGDLRYDNGEAFYVPSAMARMIRSTRTGRLYWIGNIPRTRPSADNPRYPLVIAEVDEELHALKKQSVTIIEDRDAGTQSEYVGFSNFSILENRETLEVELILPHFLEHGILPNDQADFTCNVWRYFIHLN